MLYIYTKIKIDVNNEFKFFIILIFPKFDFNLGSFFQPLRDSEHWRQNQNAFAAKIIGDEGINFLNPLPVFGINSNVPMELPILQNLSGLLNHRSERKHNFKTRCMDCLYPIRIFVTNS